jgi:hypothetical protein
VKAAPYDRIRLLEDIRTEFRNRLVPRGREGSIIERYEQPREGYLVEFTLTDPRVVGDRTWGTAIVYPDQFEVVSRHREEPNRAPTEDHCPPGES